MYVHTFGLRSCAQGISKLSKSIEVLLTRIHAVKLDTTKSTQVCTSQKRGCGCNGSRRPRSFRHILANSTTHLPDTKGRGIGTTIHMTRYDQDIRLRTHAYKCQMNWQSCRHESAAAATNTFQPRDTGVHIVKCGAASFVARF